MLVVGHSFGGALAMHLAAARPDRVAATAATRPGGRPGRQVDARDRRGDALLSRLSRPRTRPARRRRQARGRMWIPPVLDADLDEHLVKLPNGRYGWRISLPAMMSYWSELARDIVLPPAGTPTTLVRAKWTIAALCQRPTHRGAAGTVGTPISSCSISSATTWCRTPSPTMSPR